MFEALKSALKEFYRQKRKDAYVSSFQQKQGKPPTAKQLETLSAAIREEDIAKDVEEAIVEIEKIFSPTLAKKLSIFILPTAFSFAFLAASIGLVCLELHHLQIFLFKKEALGYFLSFPMLLNSIVTTIASGYLIVASLKK